MTPQARDALTDAIVRALDRQAHDGDRVVPHEALDDDADLAQAIADAVIERLAGGAGEAASRRIGPLGDDDLYAPDDALAPLADALAERLATIGGGAELPLERIRI